MEQVIEWFPGLIPTLVPPDRIQGPCFRLGLTQDRQVAVVLLGSQTARLDAACIDEAIEALTRAKTALEADTPKGADHDVHLD